MHKLKLIPMPVTPVERLAARFRDFLSIPDPSALYTLMGAVAANMIEGSPVWIMLVGPPSCGKTELLNSLLSLPQMYEGADISSEGAFLSGTPKREWAADATGGLLRQTGDHGGLILNDFTSVLSKPGEKIDMIMSIFREAFGGRWTRHIGADGGRAVQWTGKLAIFAGVTGKIDQRHQVSAELGERWIYWRFEERDVFSDCMMSSSDERAPTWRMEMRTLVTQFFADLGLKFGAQLPRRAYTNTERIKLHRIAALAARCRSGVARDNYSKEIVGTKETELATRLYTILGQLLLGFDHIGVPEKLRWRLLSKIGMDSMPAIRKRTIEVVGINQLTVANLTSFLRCSSSTTKRVVEDLEVQDVLQRENGIISFTPWMEENYRKIHDSRVIAMSALF